MRLVALMAVFLAACSALGPGPLGGRSPSAATGGLGAVFDSTPAYPGYTWSREGRAVKPEELGTIAGPAHCEWQSATMLHIGWPVGTLSTSSLQARQYIRDPQGVMQATLRDRLELRGSCRPMHVRRATRMAPSGSI